jgi:putative chitinase
MHNTVKYGDGITNKLPSIIEEVKIAQTLLGLAPDGLYGNDTVSAVKLYQQNNELAPTGVVDTFTWAKLDPVAKGFDFTFSKWKFIQAVGNAEWYQPCSTELPSKGIKNVMRVAHFLGQCGHESGGFKMLSEGLSYSAEALRKTWPKRFPDIVEATKYARNPQKIANKVYADRMGNGSEASGDGYKYRGRGLIQLTGRTNYLTASMSIFGDKRLIDNPDQVSTDQSVALKTAMWFWNTNNINALADKNDIIGVTKKINGGTIGIDHRTELTNKAIKSFT